MQFEGSRIIKDKHVFDSDFIPEDLFCRDRQTEELSRLFFPLARYGRPCSASLFGPVGSGKTLTAAKFCQDLSKHCQEAGSPVEVIKINCRFYYSESAVLLKMVRHFDKNFPERGFSPDQMWRAFKTNVQRAGRNAVLVLDEVDRFLSYAKDLVYQITRFADEGFTNGVSLSLILISSKPLADVLDDASLSSFHVANAVVFEKYSKESLARIISQRALEGLVPGSISDDIIDIMAEYSSDSGDARIALEYLEKSAIDAESLNYSEIVLDNVRAVSGRIFSNMSEQKLRTLDRSRLLVLLSVSRTIKNNQSVSITAAEKTYAVVCEEFGEKPRQHTQFWNF
ncbi:MAG: AAA family ATPase, partial [Candidatus Methanomethylophilaceae archaeon]|nr:AAA family ATPase [Candidatus Methanomethylophilaceae archaeon]